MNLGYSDKLGNYREARFLKLSNEEDFEPILTDLE
jgi:hypothetical protein